MKNKKKIRIPISFKLVTMTVGLVSVVAATIAIKNAEKFKQETINSASKTNFDIVRSRSLDVESLFVSYVDKIKIIASLISKDYANTQDREKALDITFKRDRDLISVEVRKKGKDGVFYRVVNEEYLAQFNLEKSHIVRVREYQANNQKFSIEAVFAGEIEIRNASMNGQAPMISIGIPLSKDEYGNVTDIAIGDIRLDRLQKVFNNASERVMYLVDKEGALLAHPDEDLVFKAFPMGEN